MVIAILIVAVPSYHDDYEYHDCFIIASLVNLYCYYDHDSDYDSDDDASGLL